MCDHSNKTIVEYFPVVLFIKLWKVVLTVEAVDEVLYDMLYKVAWS